MWNDDKIGRGIPLIFVVVDCCEEREIIMEFAQEFGIHTASRTADACTVIEEGVRISVLTPCMIRVEHGNFCDSPTQAVWYRSFQTPRFTAEKKRGQLVIRTEKCAFHYDIRARKMRRMELDGFGTIRGFRGNLKGTCRTLDMTNGATPLKDGIFSRSGATVIDDSKSLILTEDGTITPRPAGTDDKYYLAYGRDYRGGLREFFDLTGHTPLLPRFCLGNWWSRYWAYTQQEYLNLMDMFERKQIPLTVATVDMDWHWVDVVDKFGDRARNKYQINTISKRYDSSEGWTGYSWNTELFPDYHTFLQDLKRRHLKITLNVHPAAGIRFFEDAYPEMARAMGIDPESKQRIEFDVSDPKFIAAYFKYLHHGYEQDGVDFWWIDWQQGKKTKVPGLDPLWPLNHYHYIDSARNGKRGLILSRYAGVGSHRYPLGFSGDSAITWRTLAFQPYFNATASNIGYTWWSHDIGGHHFGYRDDELYLRWLQLGVLSPINRLHSTSNAFLGKEPWKYQRSTEYMATDWLRLRRRMIPYLYSANYQTHVNGRALIEPMYYSHPDDPEAYEVKNQFLFGPSLIAAPITEHTNKKSLMAPVRVWLDGEKYTDFFTGNVYHKRGFVTMYRTLESFPLLAKAGSIIPLDLDDISNGAELPTDLELVIFNGNGVYDLYEDDGESMDYRDGHCATRRFEIAEDGNTVTFKMNPYTGDTGVVRERMHYRLSFRNILPTAAENVKVTAPDAVQFSIAGTDNLTVELTGVRPGDTIVVTVREFEEKKSAPKHDQAIAIVARYQGSNIKKTARYRGLVREGKIPAGLSKALRGPLEELDAMEY